jgi:hypothetical protein
VGRKPRHGRLEWRIRVRAALYRVLPGNELVSTTLSFSAQNTFSGLSVHDEWQLLTASYATVDLTANGGAGKDIVVTGSGNDTVFGTTTTTSSIPATATTGWTAVRAWTSSTAAAATT